MLCMDQKLYLVQAILYSGKSFTMWKFQDFSVSQNLRETNFGESRSPKNAIFAILAALKFANLVNFSL